MQTFSTLLVIGGWLLAGYVESKTYLPPEGFELRVPQEPLRLNEGEQRIIPISVVRGEARIEDLDISVSGLPPDSGMIDSSYGVGGLSNISPLATGDAPRAIHLASDFGLFVFVGRNASQSTEVIRVWQ